jgi:hypothetical protein
MNLRARMTAIELPIAVRTNHLLSRGDESYFCVRGRIYAAHFSGNKIRRNSIEKNFSHHSMQFATLSFCRRDSRSRPESMDTKASREHLLFGREQLAERFCSDSSGKSPVSVG